MTDDAPAEPFVRGRTKGLGAKVRELVLAGWTTKAIAAELKCSTGNVDQIKRAMRRAGAALPTLPAGHGGHGMPRRHMHHIRWPGRILVPRRHQRRRTIAGRVRAGAHSTLTFCDVPEDLLDGPSKREELERILYRIKTVDDTSDDWRLFHMKNGPLP